MIVHIEILKKPPDRLEHTMASEQGVCVCVCDGCSGNIEEMVRLASSQVDGGSDTFCTLSCVYLQVFSSDPVSLESDSDMKRT